MRKRKFDPLVECVNTSNKRKKKAAIPQKGRPKQIRVVFLSKNPGVIPKGALREAIRKEGRMKDIPFLRCISKDEVKDLIHQAFSEFSKDFIFLQGHKDNTLCEASIQDFDGKGVIDHVKHGSLYLLEQQSAPDSDDTNSIIAAANEVLDKLEV